MDTTQLKITPRGVTLGLAVLVCLSGLAGCSHPHHRRSWCPPNLATPLTAHELDQLMSPASVAWQGAGPVSPLARFVQMAEISYADGRALEAEGNPACLESYYTTVQLTWPLVETYVQQGESSRVSQRAWQLYHSAVAQLIHVGQDSERFTARDGLTVMTRGGPQRLSVQVYGTIWDPQDFGQFDLVGDYAAPELSVAVRRPGLGVPLVATAAPSSRRRWMRSREKFPVTAVLRPVPCPTGVRWTLELHDPYRSQGPFTEQDAVPMAYDLTAPLAYRINHADRDWLRNFLQPGATTANTGLFMVEPYQRGKIPVVFVHGLLSDPVTWAEMANELRARPDVMQNYQLWAFEYATGQAFFASAAQLRAQLAAIRSDLDPDHRDPALDRMVIVGHSMGGLLAKLQVTSSGETIWRSVANAPFSAVRMDTESARDLGRTAFFTPVPTVSRVVFLGTPHRGSPWANRWIGRIGSALVEEPQEMEQRYTRLVADNPGVFNPEFREGPPRSIDMLKPENPLLNALCELPVSPHVTLHSIIGTGYYMHDAGLSDGVVPVASARHPRVASELLVEARHEEVHRHPQSVAELLRILREHATMAEQIR